MKATYQPAAVAELREATIWYAEVAGQRQAEALNLEVTAKLELLKGHPLIGTPGVEQTRWIPLKRFPYTLHYRVVGNVIDVLALAHQKRRPGYWRKR